MSDSTPSVDAAQSPAAVDSAPAALSAASHIPSSEIAHASAASSCEPSSNTLAPASDAPLAAPSVAAASSAAELAPPAVDASAAVVPPSQDAPSVASQASVSAASSSSATEAAALKPSASPAAPPSSARRRANPAVVSGSTAVNRSALLSSGRSSTVVPRSRASDVAKPTAATAAAKPTPKPAAATAAASSSSSASRSTARPLSATPRKPIVLAQPPPSHSAARGNRRVPQPPEPPGYSGLLYAHVLGAIFSYLEFASLRSAVCVSPSWRSAVGSMRPIAAGRFKFVYPLKKYMQLTESSPLNRHVSQVGANDATYHSQEINLTLLTPMARCFSHLTTMHIKLGSSAWMTKASKSTFVFPPSLTALAFTFNSVPRDKMPPDSMINQVTHQLLASIAALPKLSRLLLNLHWTETLDLSLLQSAHDRGSLKHLSLDFNFSEPLSAKQISALRSLPQLESMVLLVDSYDDSNHQRRLLAVPHAPFAWQRILRLRDLNAAECMELIPPLTELRDLELYRIAEGLPALHSLAHLTRLSVIMQYNATFKQAEAAALTVGLASCVHLTALTIYEAHISSAQLSEIVAHMTQLRELTLTFLAHLESNAWATTGPITQTLRALTISSSRKYVGPGQFQALRALRGLRRLEFCDAGWTGVSHEELQAATPPSSYWPAMQRFRYKKDNSWW